MFKIKEKQTHQFLARIPELNQVLFRDVITNKLELWTSSRGISMKALRLHGYEFEFIREVRAAYRVVDCDYNRAHCPHEIGRIYVDSAPSGAIVKEL